MNTYVLKKRVEAGQEYFRFLPQALSTKWIDLLEAHRRAVLSVPQSLTLLHPLHFAEYVSNIEQVLGPRSFSSEQGASSLSCAALYIWGYQCPISDNPPLCADHAFPYSLGGPTIGANKRYLCTLHNQMKSNDIHFFSWEEGVPNWFENAIHRIERLY